MFIVKHVRNIKIFLTCFTYFKIYYKALFFNAKNTITAGPAKKIKAAESNCPITCQLIIIIEYRKMCN